jgi:hypothetical protein
MVNALGKQKPRTRIATASLLSMMVILATTSLAFSNKPFGVAAANPRIYLEPSGNNFTTTTTRVGDRFNVTVKVENVPQNPGMAMWEVYLAFDDSILRVSRWFEPTWDSNYIFSGNTTSAFPYPPDDPGYVHLGTGRGRIQVAAQLFPTPPAQPMSSGSGSLCILEFNITSTPSAGNVFACSLNINNVDTYIAYPNPDVPGDVTEIPATKEDGSYSITYTAGIPPYLAVNPDFTRFSPYENVSGRMFNVSVLANQVESSINLDTVELSLAYDQSILATEPSNVTLDSLWNGPNSTTVADGKVDITVTHPATTPNGIVPIGTINFAILQQPQASLETLGSNISSGLNFVHVRFLSVGHEIPADPSKNGTVVIPAYCTERIPLFFDPAPYNIKITNTSDYTHLKDFFSVNVTIGSVFDLHSIRMRIYYDKDVVNFTVVEIDEINYNKTSGPRVAYFSPFYDQYSTGAVTTDSVNWTDGYLDINQTVYPEAKTPLSTGSGKLLQIYFYGLTNQSLSMNFSEPYGVDTLFTDSLGVTIPIEYRQRGLYAEFEYSPSSSGKPTVLDSVRFVDKSIDYDGYVTDWNWTFSDGFSSTAQNATHKFAAKGSYKVTFTVNDNNTRTSSITRTVIVYNAPPIVNFTFLPANPLPEDKISFNTNSTDPDGQKISYTWDFGDDTNLSLEQNPTHIYIFAGNYSVTLTVKDEDGLPASLTKAVLVTEPPENLTLYTVVLVVIVAVVASFVAFVVIRKRKRPKIIV